MSENKKIVVVYSSHTGFTQNYAAWLAQELHCDLKTAKEASVSDLLQYDTIIYGGGLYAVGISRIKLITKNYEKLKDKKLIIFAVGASPVREETTKEIRKANLSDEMSDVKFFYLRGGFDYSRLSPFFKLLMKLKKQQLSSMKNQTADAKGMLASYDHPLDFTNIKNIKPIIESVVE
jgi:menaquinone-dependent protoporphyrinogen IX oxidase